MQENLNFEMFVLIIFQICFSELQTFSCSCNQQERVQPIIKAETASPNKTPEKNLEDSNTSIDIVNASNLSGLEKSSPILKSKQVNHQRKGVKKRLYNNQLNKSDELPKKKKVRHEEGMPKKLTNKAKSHCGVQMFPVFEKSSRVNKENSKVQEKEDLEVEMLFNIPAQINKKTPPAKLALDIINDKTCLQLPSPKKRTPKKILDIKNDETFFQLPSPNATQKDDKIPETFFQPATTIIKLPENDISTTFYQPAEPSKSNLTTTFFEPPNPKKTFFRLKKQISTEEKENKILCPDSDDDSFNENILLEKFLKDVDDKEAKRKFANDEKLEEIPTKKTDFVYRRDAVRKKEDRAKLLGQACQDCLKYYNALDSMDAERFQERLNKCSKHRENEALSYTPAGYWNPLFTPTQK